MDVIPALLRRAKRSILTEQQYIHALDQHVTDLVEALAAAKKAAQSLDIRIVLGKVFEASDIPRLEQSLRTASAAFPSPGLGRH